MQQAGGRKIGLELARRGDRGNKHMVHGGVYQPGIQLPRDGGAWAILLLWMIGGMVSLFEVFQLRRAGRKLPRSGGEVPALSAASATLYRLPFGWVALTVGFAASGSPCCHGMKPILNSRPSPPRRWYQDIALISMVHSVNIRQSSNFRTPSALKLLLILFFIIACFALPTESGVGAAQPRLAPTSKPAGLPFHGVRDLYFSGWNAPPLL